MSGLNDLIPVLHHIRVKLYHNYLPNAPKGSYIARTDSDKTVNVKDICTIMVTRTGFDGDFATLHDYVNQFMDEVAYQICDGFTTNLSYFTIHPNIGGVFRRPTESHDHKKHPINFRFGALARLRALANKVDVEVAGTADVPAFIDEVIDVEEKSINNLYVPGNGVTIHGHKIRITDEDPACGVYFVPVLSPGNRVKATRLLENNPSKLMVIAPKTTYSLVRVEIVTRYTTGNISLQAPRTITSPFTLEEV